MKRHHLLCLAACFTGLLFSTRAFGHCQIPCGIYGDETRFELMKEHVKTVKKSMASIIKLQKADKTDGNQLTRWVVNKDKHADELMHIVTHYFLAQRVKPAKEGDAAATEKYRKQLQLLHGIIIHSMKAKQTTDLNHAEILDAYIDEFRVLYLGNGTP